MGAEPIAITAKEVAKGLSMFEIDEGLEALVEAAEQEAEANNGEISEELQRGILSDALARGDAIEGAALIKGQHVRLR